MRERRVCLLAVGLAMLLVTAACGSSGGTARAGGTGLDAAGVSPSSVKYVAIPFPDMGAALKAGRVAAISAVEPFLSGYFATAARFGPSPATPVSRRTPSGTLARSASSWRIWPVPR